MSDTAPAPIVSQLWLVDRSRYVDGQGFCKRSRLLNYHTGPNGYGIQMKGTKLPLMTGIAGHDGVRPVLEWCRDNAEGVARWFRSGAAGLLQELTTAIRVAVKQAQDAYMAVVAVRGFAYLETDENVQALVREQQYLIEGMIWAWCLEVLPEVLKRGRILEVEYDDVYVVGCTCGLGDGILTQQDHDARECQGIGLQCKPDFLLLTWSDEIEYHEFKTTSTDSPTFRDKWEVMIQMFAATLDAERRHGKQVSSIYVHGLLKGRREGTYDPATKKRDGVTYQASPFCYGYRKPANPPMEEEQWLPSYDYWDDFEQKYKRVTKAFSRTGVWELNDQAIADQGDPGLTKAEFWVKSLPGQTRRDQLILLGPFSRQQQMVSHFLQELQGEEARWQTGLWALYDLAQEILTERAAMATGNTEQDWWSLVWTHPKYQALMDQHFPRSYECRRYGMRMRCQFEGVCLEREGWQAPIGSGQFIPRRPHHAAEMTQAVARGLLPPDEGAAATAEEIAEA